MAKTAGIKWKWIGLAILTVAAVGLAAFALRPQESQARVGTAKVVSTPLASSTLKVITVAAIGDSVTEGNSPDFNNGQLGTLSWPSGLPEGEQFVGGWAKKGSTTQVMLENARPTTADVLVIIAGTNDLGKVPFATSAVNIQGIAMKSGAKRIIVSSIPPYNPSPALAVAYNQQLEPFVKAQGWEFVDAVAGIRAVNNQYSPGMTGDGVHPTEPAVKLLSAAIAKQIKP